MSARALGCLAHILRYKLTLLASWCTCGSRSMPLKVVSSKTIVLQARADLLPRTSAIEACSCLMRCPLGSEHSIPYKTAGKISVNINLASSSGVCGKRRNLRRVPMACLIRASITMEFFLAVVLMDPPRSLTLLTTGMVHPRFFRACC